MNAAEALPVILDAPCGKLEGLRKGAINVFKGVPFATARRWRAPERVAQWAGVRPARAVGAMAPQNPTPLEAIMGGVKGEKSEDCLFLNIWTPGCDARKRPVMVWIHGGAFVTGSGGVGLYNGGRLAEAGDVVIVTINYRLGSLGFLRLVDVTGGRIPSKGAEGLLDQITALEWVRDNIASFGGDADNVTIFGESAGGMSVVALMASPRARGLFHKAICQSGGGHLGHSAEQASHIAGVFLGHLGLRANDVAALESVPAQALLDAQTALIAEVDGQHDPRKIGALAFQPAIDGEALAKRPIEALREGAAAGVPLIAGTTTEEWKLWTAMDTRFHDMDEGKLERWATRLFGEAAGSLLEGDKYGSPYERYISMQTDRAFREPTLRLLAAQSAQAPVHEYVFDWRSPAMGGAFGACHALELGFVLGSYSLAGADKFFGTGPQADAINRAMMETWTSFARAGAPRASNIEAWPQWTKAQPAAMVFGADERPGHVTRFELPPAWAALSDRLVGP